MFKHSIQLLTKSPFSQISHFRGFAYLVNEVGASEVENSAAKQVLKEVVDVLKSRGHTVFLTPDFAESSSIPVLLKFGLKKSDVVSLLTKRLEFFNAPAQKLEPVLRTLILSQVQIHTALSAIVTEPKLLEEKETVLANQLLALRHLLPKNNGKSLNILLTKSPQVLFRDVEDLKDTKHELGNFFSSDEIRYMLTGYPSILLQKFEDLEFLYEYLHYVVGLEGPQIVKSQWYKHPISKIRLRYWFASKSGVYTQPNPKRPMQSRGNPSLAELLDSDDKAFAQRCRCSLDDLEAFRRIYEEDFNDRQKAERELAEMANPRNPPTFEEKPPRTQSRPSSSSLDVDRSSDPFENHDDEDEEEDQESTEAANQDRPTKFNQRWNPAINRRKK